MTDNVAFACVACGHIKSTTYDSRATLRARRRRRRCNSCGARFTTYEMRMDEAEAPAIIDLADALRTLAPAMYHAIGALIRAARVEHIISEVASDGAAGIAACIRGSDAVAGDENGEASVCGNAGKQIADDFAYVTHRKTPLVVQTHTAPEDLQDVGEALRESANAVRNHG